MTPPAARSRQRTSIRSYVCGLPSWKRDGKVFGMFQVNADESESDGIFVVAGYSATVEAWEQFTDEWLHVLNKYGNERPFKMRNAENRYGQEKYKLIMPELYAIIEKYVLYRIGFAVKVSDLKSILADTPPVGDEPDHRDPYYFTFYGFVTSILMNHPDLSEVNKMSFMFDDNNHKNKIKKTWKKFMSHAPKSAALVLEREPSFDKDDNWIPLQAADLHAWWIRRRFVERIHNEPYKEFPARQTRKIPDVTVMCDEQYLRRFRARARGEPIIQFINDGS